MDTPKLENWLNHRMVFAAVAATYVILLTVLSQESPIRLPGTVSLALISLYWFVCSLLESRIRSLRAQIPVYLLDFAFTCWILYIVSAAIVLPVLLFLPWLVLRYFVDRQQPLGFIGLIMTVAVCIFLLSASTYWFAQIYILIAIIAVILLAVICQHLASRLLQQKLDSNHNENNTKSRLLIAMSKEFRNAVNVISGHLELLDKSKNPTDQKQALHAIRGSTNTINSLVQSLHDLTKLQTTADQNNNHVEFNPRTVLQDMEYMYHGQAKVRNLSYSTLVHQDTPILVYGNESALRQLLMQLISAAIRTASNGMIDILIDGQELVSQQVELIFEVKITGEDLDVNSQADVSLALTIVKEIAQGQGGATEFRRREHEPQLLRVSIPYDVASMGELSEQQQSLEGKSVLALTGGPVGRRLNRELMEWGINIDVAETPPKFIAKLVEQANFKKHYHMVIVDQDALIGLTPESFLQMVGAEHQLSKLRYLLLVDSISLADEHKFVQAGYAVILTKPFKKPAMFNALHTAIHKRSHYENAIALVNHHPQVDNKQMSVLLVEDNHLSQKVIVAILQSCGMTVKAVGTGSAAIEQFINHQFDFVILDQNLPDIRGLEVVSKLRLNYPDIKTPILMLTAENSADLRHACEQLGIRYTLKPVTGETLLRLIDDMIVSENGQVRDAGQGARLINYDLLNEKADMVSSSALFKNEMDQFKKATTTTAESLIQATKYGDPKLVSSAIDLLLGYSNNVHAEKLTDYLTAMSRVAPEDMRKKEFRDQVSGLMDLLHQTYEALDRHLALI